VIFEKRSGACARTPEVYVGNVTQIEHQRRFGKSGTLDCFLKLKELKEMHNNCIIIQLK